MEYACIHYHWEFLVDRDFSYGGYMARDAGLVEFDLRCKLDGWMDWFWVSGFWLCRYSLAACMCVCV